MPATNDPESEGGDPPCWAHLFDDETCDGGHDQANQAGASVAAAPHTGEAQMVDLAALVRAATASGAVWTHQSEDLNVNVLVFAAGEGVAEHINTEVDVLLVGIAGEVVVAVDGNRHILCAGHALVIPKDARRSTRGQSEPFAYLTCHRRRAGLWPTREPRAVSRPSG